MGAFGPRDGERPDNGGGYAYTAAEEGASAHRILRSRVVTPYNWKRYKNIGTKGGLEMNAIDLRIGVVLISGEGGTAKSTAAQGLAEALPPIQRRQRTVAGKGGVR